MIVPKNLEFTLKLIEKRKELSDRSHSEFSKKKIMTIYLPDCYDEAILTLKEANRISTRSQAIRKAIKEFLEREIIFSKLLNEACKE